MFDPKLKEHLHGEYRTVFDKLEILCIAEYLEDKEADGQLHYLLDVFCCAQNDGVPVQKIVGKDLRAFCRDFFSVTAQKPFVRIAIQFCKRNLWIALMFLAISAMSFGARWIKSGLLAAWMEKSSFVIAGVCAFVLGLLVVLINRFWVRKTLFANSYYRRQNDLLVNLVTYIVIAVWTQLMSYVDLPFDLPRCVDLILLVMLVIGAVWLFKAPKGKHRVWQRGAILCMFAGRYRQTCEKTDYRRMRMQKTALTPQEHTGALRKRIAIMRNCFLALAVLINAMMIPIVLSWKLDALATGYIIAVFLLSSAFLYGIIVLPHTAIVHLLKKYNRTLYDDDLFDFLMEHTRW